LSGNGGQLFRRATVPINNYVKFLYKTILLNNNQLILEGLMRAMPQLTEHNQLM